LISWLKPICFLFEPSDETIILLKEETQAKQVPTNYSHQIAEKFVMSENKIIYRGRGGQISTPILRGHRAGVSCVKKPKSKVKRKQTKIYEQM
jgi:hypothetical protein